MIKPRTLFLPNNNTSQVILQRVVPTSPHTSIELFFHLIKKKIHHHDNQISNYGKGLELINFKKFKYFYHIMI
jgi:hypothetical protein